MAWSHICVFTNAKRALDNDNNNKEFIILYHTDNFFLSSLTDNDKAWGLTNRPLQGMLFKGDLKQRAVSIRTKTIKLIFYVGVNIDTADKKSVN